MTSQKESIDETKALREWRNKNHPEITKERLQDFFNNQFAGEDLPATLSEDAANILMAKASIEDKIVMMTVLAQSAYMIGNLMGYDRGRKTG
jgi:hypothetical protein